MEYNVTDSLLRIISQHEKGSGKDGYAGRKLRSILWKISLEEQEGMYAERLLSPYYTEI